MIDVTRISWAYQTILEYGLKDDGSVAAEHFNSGLINNDLFLLNERTTSVTFSMTLAALKQIDSTLSSLSARESLQIHAECRTMLAITLAEFLATRIKRSYVVRKVANVGRRRTLAKQKTSGLTVKYFVSHLFIRGRPEAAIFCHGVGTRSATPFRVSATVDTGADFLTLPDAVASRLGINLSNFPKLSIITAGGIAGATAVDNFLVEIENVLVTVKAYFCPSAPALLGLNAVLSAVDIGIQPDQWHSKP